MIAVQKDPQDIPDILRAEKTQKAIEQVLETKYFSGFLRLDILMHEEVMSKLLEIYNCKCAYCETPISTKNDSAFLTHYRPPEKYYWLAYEWTNLLPVCEECKLYEDTQFPIMAKSKRVKKPPEDRSLWQADSEIHLAEDPLILHPEIDQPEKFLALDRDGSLQAIKRNLRGSSTINAYKINLGSSAVSRRRIVRTYSEKLYEAAHQMLEEAPTYPAPKSVLEKYFSSLIEELHEMSSAKTPHALLGRNMLYNFEYFFVEDCDDFDVLRVLEQVLVHFVETLDPFIEIEFPEELKTTEEQTLILESLFVKNIRCFDKLSLDFPHMHTEENITLLVGTNGTGKSTLLQLIALGLSNIPRPPMDYGWENIVCRGKENGHLILRLQGFGEEVNIKFKIDKHGVIHTSSHRRYFEMIRKSLLILGYSTGKVGMPNYDFRNRAFAPIASLFGENGYLKTLDDHSTFSLIESRLEPIKKIMNQLLLIGEASGNAVIQSELLGLNEKGEFLFQTNRGKSSLAAMPDGFQTIFGWVLDMLLRAVQHSFDISRPESIQAIVLIDEIDAHLSPTMQRTLLPKLSALFPNIQFIIGTQSPFMIQSLESNNIVALEWEKEKVVAHPLLSEGMPWAWTISEILARLLGNVTEVSPLMDKYLTELSGAINDEDISAVRKIYQTIKSGLPKQSSFHEYLEVMTKPLLEQKAKSDTAS